jgi:hypothetical protein
VDSLGVGVIEIGRKNVPNHCQHRQEALKRCLTMPALILRLLA